MSEIAPAAGQRTRPGIERLTLRGYKSIRRLEDFPLEPINIFTGPNGAGKSNLISFLRMLTFMLTERGQLQDLIARSGGASRLLHLGPPQTQSIESQIRFLSDAGKNDYRFRLAYASGDTLVFTEESFRFSRDGYPTEASWKELDVGRRESGLLNASDQGNATARFLLGSALRIRNHQFHNTSGTARPRGKWSIDDGRWLKEDAGNVASFLYRLQQDQPRYYTRIVETIGLVLPFFSDFALDPEYGYVLLRWRERGSDYLFSAGQAADGMLRILALISLLQQPETDLPNILILDEPELGLHPHAIQILADLIRSASQYAQVIIATQSVSLIDQFEPRDIVVVDRLDGESSFRRLSKTELDDWLADYSLSELWEKNVIGGRPQRRPVNT